MPIDLKAVTISKSLEFPKWLISLYKKKQHKNQKETRIYFHSIHALESCSFTLHVCHILRPMVI